MTFFSIRIYEFNIYLFFKKRGGGYWRGALIRRNMIDIIILLLPKLYNIIFLNFCTCVCQCVIMTGSSKYVCLLVKQLHNIYSNCLYTCYITVPRIVTRGY